MHHRNGDQHPGEDRAANADLGNAHGVGLSAGHRTRPAVRLRSVSPSALDGQRGRCDSTVAHGHGRAVGDRGLTAGDDLGIVGQLRRGDLDPVACLARRASPALPWPGRRRPERSWSRRRSAPAPRAARWRRARRLRSEWPSWRIRPASTSACGVGHQDFDLERRGFADRSQGLMRVTSPGNGSAIGGRKTSAFWPSCTSPLRRSGTRPRNFSGLFDHELEHLGAGHHVAPLGHRPAVMA